MIIEFGSITRVITEQNNIMKEQQSYKYLIHSYFGQTTQQTITNY